LSSSRFINREELFQFNNLLGKVSEILYYSLNIQFQIKEKWNDDGYSEELFTPRNREKMVSILA
jgi:hypothetical protein